MAKNKFKKINYSYNAQRLGEVLNTDLSFEYAHWHFYTHAAGMVRGLHRAEYSELFLKHAAGEAQHIAEFQKLILSLNIIPTTETAYGVLPSNEMYDPIQLILHAISMEKEVVNNYLVRLEQAQKLQETDMYNGKYIELFLEDQILDSRGDVNEFELLIKGQE